MGHDPHGRRHATPAWLDLIEGDDPLSRGRKLVVLHPGPHRWPGLPINFS